MKRVSTIVIALALAGAVLAQNFECAPLGPLPGDPSTNCEGVSSDGQVALTGVSGTAACGFPTGGTKYLDMRANGPIPVPAGGPIARPVFAIASEVRIPIPAGATSVSFNWDFFNAEGANSASFNDGVSVDIVDPAGGLVAGLVYADTWSGLLTGGCASGGTELAPAGPQTYAAVLPAYAVCDYISIVIWNGGDNAVQSRAYFDDFVFDSALPGCLPPCFPVPAVITYSSPFGMGSLQVNMAGLAANGTYFFVVTLNAGAYPNGWLYGVDIPPSELVGLINFNAPPFFGPTNSCGAAAIGPVAGVPSGLTIYALAFGIPTGGSTPNGHTPATTYTIP